MAAICLSCHSEAWVRGHFDRYEKSHETTNAATVTATAILEEIWQRGAAEGLAAGGSPFDEAIEHRWADIWLFYRDSMTGTSAAALTHAPMAANAAAELIMNRTARRWDVMEVEDTPIGSPHNSRRLPRFGPSADAIPGQAGSTGGAA
jgi:hypothetical protein